jgi:hydroxymethylglutaryl-CoA reductase
MPTISQKNKDKISEQILAHLFSLSPEPQYTSSISSNLARDEEFVKSLLLELEKKSLVVKITKSPQGQDFTRRQRWRLSNSAFEAYKKMQNSKSF